MTDYSWVTDPYLGSAAAAAATQAAIAHDAERVLATLAEAAPAERSILVTSVADAADTRGWLIAMLRERPDDPWLNTLAARAYLNWAWEARTALRAKYVTPEGWEGFRARSGAAADIISHTRARNPGHGAIGMAAVTAALAGHGDAEAFRRALAEVDTVYPDDYPLARVGVDYFAEKWYGSTAESWDYALTRARHAPLGSALAALPAAAIVEQLLFARKSPGALPKKRLNEILDETAARSVGHPEWQWTPAGWAAANELVLAYLQLGRTSDARSLHTWMGAGRRTASPWLILDPVRRTKDFALLSGTG